MSIYRGAPPTLMMCGCQVLYTSQDTGVWCWSYAGRALQHEYTAAVVAKEDQPTMSATREHERGTKTRHDGCQAHTSRNSRSDRNVVEYTYLYINTYVATTTRDDGCHACTSFSGKKNRGGNFTSISSKRSFAVWKHIK